MTTNDRTPPDAATIDRLKLMRADIRAAAAMGNLGLAASLTMRYLDELTGSDDKPASEAGH